MKINFEDININYFPKFPISYEGEGDGGGGEGGTGDQTVTVEDLQKQINALSGTNENLKKEKTEIQNRLKGLSKVSETFEKLGGEDGVTRLLKYQDSIEKDEMLKLLADGKHDEYFEKRTSSLHKSHQNELEKRDTAYSEVESRAAKAEKAYELLKIDIDVREAARKLEGFEDSAIPDAVLLANNIFAFDPEFNQPVMKDEEGGIVYGADGKKPKTILEWIRELQEEKPHWWGETKGSGGRGGKGRKGSELTLEQQLSAGMLTMDQYRKVREERKFKNHG